MYAPAPFSESDAQQIAAFINAHPLATLITATEAWPTATHLPLLLYQQDGRQVLEGHIALANPQAAQLQEGTNVLATFLGPDAYISASWYSHTNVSTWNYQSVHVHGCIRLQTEEALYSSLQRLMAHFERAAIAGTPTPLPTSAPVLLENLPSRMVQGLMKEIKGFVVEITDWQAAFKLSQNRSSKDYASIIAHLEQTDNRGAHEIALQMKSRIKAPIKSSQTVCPVGINNKKRQ